MGKDGSSACCIGIIEGVDQRQYVVAGRIQYFQENRGETITDSIHGITLEGLVASTRVSNDCGVDLHMVDGGKVDNRWK